MNKFSYNDITRGLMELVSDVKVIPDNVAFNIREDSGCAGRQSTKNIKIVGKTDKPGIDIIVKPGTKNETVYIPAFVTHTDIEDLVYNDFYIGEGADVVVVAGCGIHNEGHAHSMHNGIHRFFVGKGAKVLYLEKHIGTGDGDGKRIINPVTECFIEEDGYMKMDTTQLRGVDSTVRKSSAKLAAGAKLVIREKIMTHGEQFAQTDFDVDLDGEGCGVDLVSRSVAKGKSSQVFNSKMNGNSPCTGYSSCDAIIMDDAKVVAMPALSANHVDAALIHEAAVGKIAGEQLIKLMTLGLTEAEAEAKIIEGFLK